MNAAIELAGLSCRYDTGGRPALADVDLVVPRGAFVVVMGATGAGKSTLARCLTRIVPCFVPGTVDGDVRLGGASIVGRTPGELAGAIGMVFQDFEAQLFSSDVTQELAFGLEHTGVPPAEMPGRVRAALAAVGLAGFEERDPTTLSGGEKQRLAIAGLLAMRPAVMVLDEPTTDLDPAGRAEVLRVLADLRGEGLTLVVIDHDPATAADADLLVLLREGRVVASGPPVRLLADVAALRAAGVRPPDVSCVFATLGLPAPPLDLAAAAAALRAARGAPQGTPVVAAPRPARPLVVVEHLEHRYPDGRVAIADVGFTIAAGEFVALLGRNGSGKTTLVKHLNGLLKPTAGHVLVGGDDVSTLPLEHLAQRVGYVFQDPDHQLFAPTVEEEVAFGPRNLGLPPAAVEERVAEALGAVGLADRGVDPFVLDKGARQRLAVATVLALRPAVLVLDEPTTGLDAAEQARMLGLLRALHAAGRTIVVITHTPWVVAESADRVLLLADGRLRYDGPVREFYADSALVAEPAARPPDVTRLGRLLGCTPLTVPELAAWLGGGT